jgi:hypothetical protein
MQNILRSPAKTRLFRSLPLLLLIFGMGLAPAAQAADTITATITVYAPGATAGAPLVVQFQDGFGNWNTVDGWKGTLDGLTDVGVPFKKWAVYQANFGQGPFRWVVFNMDGQTIWGTSDAFNLPPGGGIELTQTIVPGVTGIGTATGTATVTATVTATATPSAPAATPTPSTATPVPPTSSALLLANTGSSTFGLVCNGACDHSTITAYFMGVPATSWFAVQWGDGLGNWENVQGWQGTADTVTGNPTGVLIKQWTVFRANYGQGPFRWAVYSGQGGTLLDYSAGFNLPTGDGQNFFMSLSK